MKKIITLFAFIIPLSLILCSCNNISEVTNLTDTTETTEVTKFPLLYTEYTISVSSEPAYIQEKLDVISAEHHFPFPSKVIITCGEERGVPWLLLQSGRFYGSFDVGKNGVAKLDGWGRVSVLSELASAVEEHESDMPTFSCSSLDELVVYVNDENVNIDKYILFNENGEKIEYGGSGRYYAYCSVTCKGPDVMQNGEKYDSQSAHYAAVFIVEITE